MTPDPIDLLPNAPLADGGRISSQFQCRGIDTFRAACLWVRDLPYGPNNAFHPGAIFEDNRGTCRSKHGLIAALAHELDLPVHQYAGAYRLDESIIDGIGPILAAHGLRFVPQLHCVLKCGPWFLDLTAGNCHGKKKDVMDMDAYFRVTPFASEDEDRTVYVLAVQYYQRTEPALARVSVSQIRQIARTCSAMTRTLCAVA